MASRDVFGVQFDQALQLRFHISENSSTRAIKGWRSTVEAVELLRSTMIGSRSDPASWLLTHLGAPNRHWKWY